MKIRQLRELPDGFNLQEITNYHSKGAAGIDLVTAINVAIGSESCAIVPTGIAVEIPTGLFGLIRPRSGLATKSKIGVLSSCIVDEDYRGEVFVNLINHGKEYVGLFPGQRIAQLVLLPYHRANLEWVEDLEPTERGFGGHGSTGL